MRFQSKEKLDYVQIYLLYNASRRYLRDMVITVGSGSTFVEVCWKTDGESWILMIPKTMLMNNSKLVNIIQSLDNLITLHQREWKGKRLWIIINCLLNTIKNG